MAKYIRESDNYLKEEQNNVGTTEGGEDTKREKKEIIIAEKESKYLW